MERSELGCPNHHPNQRRESRLQRASAETLRSCSLLPAKVDRYVSGRIPKKTKKETFWMNISHCGYSVFLELSLLWSQTTQVKQQYLARKNNLSTQTHNQGRLARICKSGVNFRYSWVRNIKPEPRMSHARMCCGTDLTSGHEITIKHRGRAYKKTVQRPNFQQASKQEQPTSSIKSTWQRRLRRKKVSMYHE